MAKFRADRAAHAAPPKRGDSGVEGGPAGRGTSPAVGGLTVAWPALAIVFSTLSSFFPSNPSRSLANASVSPSPAM